MTLIRASDLRTLGEGNYSSVEFRKSASDKAGLQLAVEKLAYALKDIRSYDVFLSHRRLDANLILGLKRKLVNAGYSTYVYWLDDDYAPISTDSGNTIREQMKQCSCLLYASTENSPSSKWMPWELGYMDGLKSKSAIVPILERPDSSKSDVIGQEYLALYPYIDATPNRFWVNKGDGTYVSLRDWINA